MKRTVAAAVLGTIAACSAFFAATGPAYAASCSASQITVVVQFPSRTEIGCSAGNVGSGYDALRSAGFSYTLATGNGAGAICGIDGYPRTTCASMPPANAYWAYFRGKPGGGWTYSTVGGGSSNADPGTVEGWRFQDTSTSTPPSSPPPGPANPSPTSAPTKKPVVTPTRSPGSAPTRLVAPDATATATGSAVADSSPSASANASDLPLTGSPTVGASTSATAPTDATLAAGPAETSVEDSASSGGLSWIWGLVLLGVLAAAGGGTVLLRRRG
ncbi:MAG: hypothetical protein NTV23_03005 [Propionibacteriales bacterium]|nr:hypothetical protein [Propionibacteriales bacterium]